MKVDGEGRKSTIRRPSSREEEEEEGICRPLSKKCRSRSRRPLLLGPFPLEWLVDSCVDGYVCSESSERNPRQTITQKNLFLLTNDKSTESHITSNERH